MGVSLRVSNLPVSNHSTASRDHRNTSVGKWLRTVSLLLAPIIGSCGGSSPIEGKDGGSHGDGNGNKSALCSEAQGNPLRYVEVYRGGELQEGSSSVEVVEVDPFDVYGAWASVRAIGPNRLSIDKAYPDGSKLVIDDAGKVDFNMPDGELSVSACSVNSLAGQHDDGYSAVLALSRNMPSLFCSPNNLVATTLFAAAGQNSSGVEFGDGFRLSIRFTGLSSSGTIGARFYPEVLDSNGVAVWNQPELVVPTKGSAILNIPYDGRTRDIKIMDDRDGHGPGTGIPFVDVKIHDCSVQ